jgi:hypothetical protein
MTATRVQCRCGEVEIELTAKPLVQLYCHCDDCQAVHGAAYVPESVYPSDAVTIIRGAPRTWTLKRNPRFFCGECGTRLFIEVLAFKLRGLNGYLLPEGQFRPAFHVHCRFAVRPVSDELPHFKAMPARFSGSDEVVDW